VAADGFSDSGMNKMSSRFLLPLVAIPLVSLFYVCFDSRRNLWTKFILGTVVLGLLALFNVFYQNAERAGGGHNESAFGFSALALTCIVIASYHPLNKVRFGRFYYFAGVSMGFCAMFLSGTRTAWIAAIVIVMIAVVFYLDRYALWKRIAIAMALIGAISAGGMTIPLVQERIEKMVEMTAPYIKGEEQTKFTSLRYRVELWKAGWQIGMTDKIFGIGPGNVKRALKAFAAENQDKRGMRRVGRHNHIHNQFIQTFVMSGVVGLIGLMALIIGHLWIFTKYLGKGYSVEVRSLALAGFLLLVAYLIKSFPGVPFYGKQYLMIYAFSTASIWGCLLGALQQTEVTTASPAS
jgi:O-antigen ligase